MKSGGGADGLLYALRAAVLRTATRRAGCAISTRNCGLQAASWICTASAHASAQASFAYPCWDASEGGWHDQRIVGSARTAQATAVTQTPSGATPASFAAVLGFLAGGPVGALAGAAVSMAASAKDSLPGHTERTEAKAAEPLCGAAFASYIAGALCVEREAGGAEGRGGERKRVRIYGNRWMNVSKMQVFSV